MIGMDGTGTMGFNRLLHIYGQWYAVSLQRDDQQRGRSHEEGHGIDVGGRRVDDFVVLADNEEDMRRALADLCR